uniref:BPTI/Kunitz inhibitor domain-containing protein n=1 Tax=Setaria digitata TaxID=48799 RepID=A0A915Q2E3_9BILA
MMNRAKISSAVKMGLTVCFLKFDTNLLYGCTNFDWRPRFFYNQTSSKCEMFWYDASCPKQNEFINMFYHRGACKRLCQQSKETTRKSSQQSGLRRIGQISATFSHPYGSKQNHNHGQLIRMQNIFDNFFVDARIRPVKMVLSEMSKSSLNHIQDPSNPTSTSYPSQSHIDEVPTDVNISNDFDFHILKNDFRRSLPKVLTHTLSRTDYKYNRSNGLVYSSTPSTACLEPLTLGSCSQMYPFYYYNRDTQRCEPFIYSGCGGNSNRFFTLRQCEIACSQLRGLSPLETNCLLPFDGGERIDDIACVERAGIRYYYNQIYGRCERFYYSGCAGNGNRFHDFDTCETVCRHVPIRFALEEFQSPKDLKVCFEPITEGKCLNHSRKSVERWAYNHLKLQCVLFNYNGCNGNRNRFATEYSCNALCKGLKRPLHERCIGYPEWGNCNQLNYQWFYNITKGSCEQFLWGGCNDGNENRFGTFEECQRVCEVPAENACSEPLDRGHWCESMSNRYYYNSNTNTCKGFHYTGCGKSRNIFMTQGECEEKCINQANLPSSTLPLGITSSVQVNYKSVKPVEKQLSNAHQILIANSAPYLKTDNQWLEYGKCVGYRYNITGKMTRLTSYLCSMETGGTCLLQVTLTTTNGDEKCRLVQPWLKGMHLYSWFFTLDHRQPYPFSKQALNEAIAALIILPPNDCHSIC